MSSCITDIITGERLESLCDHILNTSNVPDIPYIATYFNHKCINIYAMLDNEFDNKQIIYIKTDYIVHNIPHLILFLQKCKNKIILVIHNSDYSFDERHLVLFTEIPKLKHIYTQNVNVNDSRVSPLPIGISNRRFNPDGIETIARVSCENNKKDKFIYFNFTIDTNPGKRLKCFHHFNNAGVPYIPNMSFNDYIRELSRYKYCICPDGNGIDTHRLWECLYVKTIPICMRSINTEYFAQFMPIILVNDWSEVDIPSLEALEYKWEPKEKAFLTLSYQYEMIYRKATEPSSE